MGKRSLHHLKNLVDLRDAVVAMKYVHVRKELQYSKFYGFASVLLCNLLGIFVCIH